MEPAHRPPGEPAVCDRISHMSAHDPRGPAKGTVRRSFALPARLVEEVREAAPEDGPKSLNAVVRVALEQFVARRREEEFAEAMERMAADPQVRRLCRKLDREFRCTEMDGLDPDEEWPA